MKPKKKSNTVSKSKLSPKVLSPKMSKEVSPKRGATVKNIPQKTLDIDKLEKEVEGILSG